MTESPVAVAERASTSGTQEVHFVRDDDVEQLDVELVRRGVDAVYFECSPAGAAPLIEQLVTRGDAPSWTGDGWEALWDVLHEVRSALDQPTCVIARCIDRLVQSDLIATTELAGMLYLFTRDLSALGPAVHAVMTTAE